MSESPALADSLNIVRTVMGTASEKRLAESRCLTARGCNKSNNSGVTIMIIIVIIIIIPLITSLCISPDVSSYWWLCLQCRERRGLPSGLAMCGLCTTSLPFHTLQSRPVTRQYALSFKLGQCLRVLLITAPGQLCPPTRAGT